MSQHLADPLRANFREFVAIVNYSYRRFDVQARSVIARYGLDPKSQNYRDLFLDYNMRVADYGNSLGQRHATNLLFLEPKISCLINPKYNLRI
jgi:hypothetical protein